MATSQAQDDQVELTILCIKSAFVCKVPPLTNSDGHRAESWDRTAIWDGRLRIVSKGKHLVILLEHNKGKEAGTLFAACPIQNDPKKPPSVEYVLDSSRYFVLRIEDGKGRHAFMGLFFNSRDEAFDFKAALQHEQNLQQEEERAKQFTENLPVRDFSLPTGKSITINLKKKVGNATNKEDDEDDHVGHASSSLSKMKLAGPSSASTSKKSKAASSSSSSSSTSSASNTSSSAPASDPFASDDWGDFQSSDAKNAASGDQWVSFE